MFIFYYQGRDTPASYVPHAPEWRRYSEPVVCLSFDSWDDFGFRTTFSCYVWNKEQWSYLGRLKVMIENEHDSHAYLEGLNDIAPGIKKFFLARMHYLALAETLSFYRNLVQELPEDWPEFLRRMHDVVYLEQTRHLTENLDLRNYEAFGKSLLRGEGVEAYGLGRSLLFPELLNPSRFDFALTFFPRGVGSEITTEFDFTPDDEYLLPHYVNILIGKNGLGKSRLLYSVLTALEISRDSENSGHIVFKSSDSLPFRKILASSYSVFEQFPTESPRSRNLNYAYCGFRTFRSQMTLDLVKEICWKSFVQIFERDFPVITQNTGELTRPKRTAYLRTLQEGILFEDILILLKDDVEILPEYGIDELEIDGSRYLKISPTMPTFNGEFRNKVEGWVQKKELVFKTPSGIIGHLSSGQAMFCCLVSTLIAEIERESLLLIDEPELHLHPNLICTYVGMLKVILRIFDSYAIVATHSSIVVREFSGRRVKVFFEGPDGTTVIKHPMFDTFGADIGEITNHIFENVLFEKPFQKHLDKLIKDGMTFEQIYESYKDILNPDCLAYIRNAFPNRSE